MKNFTICLSFLAVLGLASAVAFADDKMTSASANDCNSDAHYPLISKSELKTVAQEKSAVIFDVNSADSYKKAHVPGAIHYESHEKDFATLLPAKKDAMIVAYCGGVQCEAWKKAAVEACNQGYTNIRHFKEGITGWVKN
jgi:rhodanese-related sulfurtransferase